MRTTEEQDMKTIMEMCNPLIGYLKAQCDPYTEILVTQDGVKVKQTIMGMPEKEAAN